MDPAVHSPLRFLAPIALLAAVAIVALVVAASVGGEGETGSEPGASAPQERPNGGGAGQGDAGGTGPATYEVQSGDTLDSIAEDTGVTVGQLLELNPGIDPEALSTGQELKLRE